MRPILDDSFAGLSHSAALLGTGSEVLGYDTPRSMDHGWGARIDLFVEESAREELAPAIDEALRRDLPRTFLGLPTGFRLTDEPGTLVLGTADDGAFKHGVTVRAVGLFCRRYLGVDVTGEIGIVDWLLMSPQKLLTVTNGPVFHDGLGLLAPLRERLRYYPDQVWVALLAAQWRRIAQEEPFMARCADVGDDLGSRVVAARLVREVMRLCFLMERRYWPFTKWFGTAFARLACAPRLTPIFAAALAGDDWLMRERHLSAAYEAVAAMHNALGLTEPLPTTVSPFHTRPYLVIQADRFADALAATLNDPILREAARVGSIEQMADSTDVLSNAERSGRLRALYDV